MNEELTGKLLKLAEAVVAGRTTKEARAVRDLVRAGDDPLGDRFCQIHTPRVRRAQGATYTPLAVVESLVLEAEKLGPYARVVDVGCGSARFLLACGRRFPAADLVGVELDPVATALARANLAAAGMVSRGRILQADYRDVDLGSCSGRTLYIGNPPYVRHHGIAPEWKAWLAREAAGLGQRASGLAGLHIHFLLATALKAVAGDVGVLITASEWLDVNYGALARALLAGRLGLLRLTVVAPEAAVFADAMTTAAVMCFQVGTRRTTVDFKRVTTAASLSEDGAYTRRPRAVLALHRWSPLLKDGPLEERAVGDLVPLGEICRVSRGQVTGSNNVWIAGPQAAGLPDRFLLPAVTRGRELFGAGAVLADCASLRRVVDLPVDLDVLDTDERCRVDRFLRYARGQGAHLGYIATHRPAWWAVGLKDPAPILATYMARRSPAFVINQAQARHLNIAHGLYPRVALSNVALTRLAAYLGSCVRVGDGRTYAGGLTKFEPREMERLLVPRPEILEQELTRVPQGGVR